MRNAYYWLCDFIADYWGAMVLAAAVIGLVVLCAMSDDARCKDLMRLARTSRDSLDATIACERIRSSTAQTIAIGAAAGAMAGSRR